MRKLRMLKELFDHEEVFALLYNELQLNIPDFKIYNTEQRFGNDLWNFPNIQDVPF